MNFKEMLLEVLLEGKLEDTLDRHPLIPDDVKQNYLKQIPASNAQHLDWVLSQHTKGNINSSHDINGILNTFNKVKDKLHKKQIHQYGSMDELHTAISPHKDTVKKTDNEKSKDGTETLYTSPTMTVTQHHNYESCISAANLPASNPRKEKAGWCVSVGDGGGAGHYSTYTDNGFHPVYTIEHKHEDGTSSKHMLVYSHNKTQENQELRNEADHRPGFNDNSSTRPDLLDNYGKEHHELMKTPITHLFNETGREQYKKEAEPAHKKLKEILSNIPKTGMSDEEYMANFNEGLKKQQGGIHNELAKSQLSPTQLTHLIEQGNDGCKHDIAQRQDLSDTHTQKLANTSNMLVHHSLLQKPDISIDSFNTIVKKAHPEVIDRVVKYQKLNETHIDTILNKKITNVNLTPLVNRLHDKLTSTHISGLIDKGDVHTHRLLASTHYDKLEPHHIKSLQDKGDDDTNRLLKVNTDISNDPTHIQSLIDKGDNVYHHILLDNFSHKLEPHHIQSLIDKGDSSVYGKLVDNLSSKLSPTHIQSIIDKDNRSIKYNLINNLSDKLEPHHIQSLIDKGDKNVHSRLIDKLGDKLDTNHIQSLINKGDENVHYKLIDELDDKLKPHHIQSLINKGDSDISYRLISDLSDKLDTNHIQSLINNDNDSVNYSLINNLSDKLDTNHIQSLINKGDKNVHTKLIDKLGYKLEPKHIKSLMDNASPQIVNDVYNNLPTESKKAAVIYTQTMKDRGNKNWINFYNIHKDMDNVLKECHFTNSNFKRLLKESLIT